MKPLYARALVLTTTLACLALGSGLDWITTVTVGQEVERRWIVLFRQQGFLPDDATAIVAGAGGTIVARLPEIGALVARSSNAEFARIAARDPKVSDVAEDIEVQMIPGPDRLRPQILGDADVAAAAATEAPGSDAQTGPDPFYNAFQWDKKRMRASNQGSYGVQRGRPDLVVAVLDTGADILPVPHVD